jgi:hypothetical protein
VLGCSVQTGSTEQCRCSDIRCISVAIDNSSAATDPECCLWDFPPNLDDGVTSELQELGYAFGRTTSNAPRFCISYPVPSGSVDLKNYFIVKLDLQGPDLCISELGRSENKSCSVQLQTVKKADYCSGVPVTGAHLVNFSVDCLNCDVYTANFQFRVYSEAFNATQESWCDKIDRSVPSEKYYMQNTSKPSDEEKHTRTDPLVDENPSPDEYHNSGASRLLTYTLPAVVTILTALLIA